MSNSGNTIVRYACVCEVSIYRSYGVLLPYIYPSSVPWSQMAMEGPKAIAEVFGERDEAIKAGYGQYHIELVEIPAGTEPKESWIVVKGKA